MAGSVLKVLWRFQRHGFRPIFISILINRTYAESSRGSIVFSRTSGICDPGTEPDGEFTRILDLLPRTSDADRGGKHVDGGSSTLRFPRPTPPRCCIWQIKHFRFKGIRNSKILRGQNPKTRTANTHQN